MTYKESEYKHVENLLDNSSVFYGDAGNGSFRGKHYRFILENWHNNLYEPIRKEVIEYFGINKISWWGGSNPSAHPLSSQIACINHLFYIRNINS